MKTIKKVVDKRDYIVDSNTDGLSGIINKKTLECVFGGDSANEDDYNKSYIESVYEEWDGTLYDDGDGYGFLITLNR